AYLELRQSGAASQERHDERHHDVRQDGCLDAFLGGQSGESAQQHGLATESAKSQRITRAARSLIRYAEPKPVMQSSKGVETRLTSVSVRCLLVRRRKREFAVADAHGEALGKLGGRFLAIGHDKFGKSREQARLRQAIAIDPVDARLRP